MITQAIILIILYTTLLTIFYYLGPLSKLSQLDQIDLILDANEPDEIFSSSETSFTNKASSIIYFTVGIFVWIYIGMTAAKFSLLITSYNYLNWLIYFLTYFIFLRIPFGTMHKVIAKVYELDHNPHKTVFAILMLISYLITILTFSKFPHFLKWPL